MGLLARIWKGEDDWRKVTTEAKKKKVIKEANELLKEVKQITTASQDIEGKLAELANAMKGLANQTPRIRATILQQVITRTRDLKSTFESLKTLFLKISSEMDQLDIDEEDLIQDTEQKGYQIVVRVKGYPQNETIIPFRKKVLIGRQNIPQLNDFTNVSRVHLELKILDENKIAMEIVGSNPTWISTRRNEEKSGRRDYWVEIKLNRLYYVSVLEGKPIFAFNIRKVN